MAGRGGAPRTQAGILPACSLWAGADASIPIRCLLAFARLPALLPLAVAQARAQDADPGSQAAPGHEAVLDRHRDWNTPFL